MKLVRSGWDSDNPPHGGEPWVNKRPSERESFQSGRRDSDNPPHGGNPGLNEKTLRKRVFFSRGAGILTIPRMGGNPGYNKNLTGIKNLSGLVCRGAGILTIPRMGGNPGLTKRPSERESFQSGRRNSDNPLHGGEPWVNEKTLRKRVFFSRGAGIRTLGLLHPMQARYRTAPRPAAGGYYSRVSHF